MLVPAPIFPEPTHAACGGLWRRRPRRSPTSSIGNAFAAAPSQPGRREAVIPNEGANVEIGQCAQLPADRPLPTFTRSPPSAASSACASAICGISGVGEKPWSAGARAAWASAGRPVARQAWPARARRAARNCAWLAASRRRWLSGGLFPISADATQQEIHAAWRELAKAYTQIGSPRLACPMKCFVTPTAC